MPRNSAIQRSRNLSGGVAMNKAASVKARLRNLARKQAGVIRIYCKSMRLNGPLLIYLSPLKDKFT